MSGGSDKKIPFEGLKVFLILENGVVRYFSFDALLEGKELMGTLVGFRSGVLLGISPRSNSIGEI